MLSRVYTTFLVRMQHSLQPLFQGRVLLLTNTLSGGVLMALGDTLQQSRENYKEPGRVRDWRRTGRMLTVGCSFGPVVHYWYLWLDGVFVGNALETVGKKLFMDQVVFSPVLWLSYFLGTSLMEGHTLSEGWNEFTDKFLELYTVECCVWLPAQAINFYFLAPKFHVVYINFITLGWDTYLSHIKHRDDSRTELLADSSAVEVQQEALPSSKDLEEKTRDGVNAQV
ncbi:mpv17-like protein 2 [Clinocottus analis]|uniref:mpv17-like protein 2 n=1 Tax=Clinocottus analis TaxID=304258 RepID=UPI0035C06E3A